MERRPALPAWVQPLPLPHNQIAVFRVDAAGASEWTFYVDPSTGLLSPVEYREHHPRAPVRSFGSFTSAPPDVWIEAATGALAKMGRAPSSSSAD